MVCEGLNVEHTVSAYSKHKHLTGQHTICYWLELPKLCCVQHASTWMLRVTAQADVSSLRVEEVFTHAPDYYDLCVFDVGTNGCAITTHSFLHRTCSPVPVSMDTRSIDPPLPQLPTTTPTNPAPIVDLH